MSALHHAAARGKFETTSLLMRAGADTSIADKLGRSACDVALAFRKEKRARAAERAAAGEEEAPVDDRDVANLLAYQDTWLLNTHAGYGS